MIVHNLRTKRLQEVKFCLGRFETPPTNVGLQHVGFDRDPILTGPLALSLSFLVSPVAFAPEQHENHFRLYIIDELQLLQGFLFLPLLFISCSG